MVTQPLLLVISFVSNSGTLDRNDIKAVIRNNFVFVLVCFVLFLFVFILTYRYYYYYHYNYYYYYYYDDDDDDDDDYYYYLFCCCVSPSEQSVIIKRGPWLFNEGITLSSVINNV